MFATAGAGLYLGTVTLPSPQVLTGRQARLLFRTFVLCPEIDTDDVLKTELRFLDGNKKLLVQSPRRSFIINLAAGPNESGDYPHETIATGRMSTELAAIPSGLGSASKVAFVDFFQVYLAPGVNADEPVWSKPGNATDGLVRLSVDGGHDITWSGDGKRLFWFLGAFLHSVEVSKLDVCASAAVDDPKTHGVACARNLPQFQEIIVEYPSDIKRLKKEASASISNRFARDPEALKNADFFVIANATLLTMETGDLRFDVLRDAVLVTRSGEIEAIVGVHDLIIPYGATVLDAQGGFVVPGFIDVHAHWNGFGTTHPARSWEMETFLAYGVTTLHNPSADNVLGFAERFRLERGQLVGPRIFQVGDVIYGAGAPSVHQDIVDMAEARSALIRIKAEGGPASFSYKNYNQPSRASRQRLLLAGRNLSMLCVPEGGMNYDWDQTYIVDGMTNGRTRLAHPCFYIWASEDIPDDLKLRRFTRHDILEGLSESTARPKSSYALFNTSISTAKMVHMGLRAHIGAHGEPPLGLNYHAEMFFTRQGGLSNYEVLRAATSDAAITLGIEKSVGSLTPGKLADLIIYPPGVDLLEGDISGTRDIKFVARGGRVWDADTMTEVWPVKGRREAMPPLNPE
ncbi:hypothetical protein A0H81_04846 [Grifola frondosa]|uniref:Amidohydrolase-related domain-containing protein n=1 Tax=Grifola frondosa TaxID=5627 RepID=A0A1C7MFJ3_GRIFR|nr:hypothetical protein A0H81_04846 [Grifola frondosa]